MVAENYIGTNGLVTQTLDRIIEVLADRFKSIYGYDVNLEQNSPDGQLINLFAQEKKDILDLITAIYNNLDVDTAIGLAQQVLYKLNGLTIKAYTYSYCYVNVTVTKSITLQGLDDNIENIDGTGFTVVDNNGNRWILAESHNLDAGTHLLNFRSAELGSITALPNTITIMETILAGVYGVNNPANNYITGQTGETSAEFRTRRNKMMAVPSQGFDESIESQLLNLSDVTQAKVYDNRTNTTQDGIPAHTIWVIVEGGTSEEIGQVIYANIPPGIPMKGGQQASILRPNGKIATVNYDLPNPINLYIRATIKNLSDNPLDEAYIKQELAKTTFNIGESAQSSNITLALKNVIDVSGNPYNVEVSINGTNYSPLVTPTGLADYFVIAASNIDFTVV